MNSSASWTNGKENCSSKPNLREPRICIVSGRALHTAAWRAAFYEAEDVLIESDDAELIYLRPVPGLNWKRRAHAALMTRGLGSVVSSLNPGLHPVSISRPRELFVFICHDQWDLQLLGAVKGWKENCQKSICWINELYAWEVPRLRGLLEPLKQFDHVLLGLGGTVPAVEKELGRPCHYLQCGIDAVRFSPFPKPPKRSIDVYSIGRRWEPVHAALRALSGDEDLLYLYDTVADGAIMRLLDYRQHRDLFASLAKRSSFFIVAPAKMDYVQDTRGQPEIGYRFFEGSTAGAIMLGQRPSCPAFEHFFPWQDAVIPVQIDGSDIKDVIHDLKSQPDRLAAISRRNSSEALRRHDWIYRWRDIFKIADVKPGPGFELRTEQLQKLADMACSPASEFEVIQDNSSLT